VLDWLPVAVGQGSWCRSTRRLPRLVSFTVVELISGVLADFGRSESRTRLGGLGLFVIRAVLGYSAEGTSAAPQAIAVADHSTAVTRVA